MWLARNAFHEKQPRPRGSSRLAFNFGDHEFICWQSLEQFGNDIRFCLSSVVSGVGKDRQ